MKWTRVLSFIGFVLAWQVLATWGGFPPYKLPSPAAVVWGTVDLALVGMPPGRLLHQHTLYSLYRVGAGFVAAVVIAVPLGIIMGRWERVRDIVDPVVELIRPIPPLAWIPMAIVWFGIGNSSAAFIIFLGAFFPILLSTVSGVVTVDKILIEAAYTLNASGTDILLKVLLPGALPSVFTGMRIGLGIGWMTVVAAEFVGVREGLGLGYMIMTARDVQRPDEILAGMLVIGLTGLLINAALRWTESFFIRWK